MSSSKQKQNKDEKEDVNTEETTPDAPEDVKPSGQAIDSKNVGPTDGKDKEKKKEAKSSPGPAPDGSALESSLLDLTTAPTVPKLPAGDDRSPDEPQKPELLNLNAVSIHTIPFSDKFYSAWGSVDVYNLDLQTIYQDHKLKVSAWVDNDSRIMAMHNMVLQILKLYSVVYKGVKDVPQQLMKNTTVTELGSIGANIMNLVERPGAILEGDRVRMMALWDTFNSDDVVGNIVEMKRYSKRMTALVSPEEFVLQSKLSELEKAKILRYDDPPAGIEMARDFYGSMAVGRTWFVPAGNTVDFDFYFFIKLLQQQSSAYDYLVEHNVELANVAYETVAAIVHNVNPIPTRGGQKNFEDAAAALNIRSGEFAEKNLVPAQMSENKARDFAKALLTVWSMNDEAAVDYEWVDGFRLVALHDAIMHKLVMPNGLMFMRARNKIDNYIAMHLMTKTPGYRHRVDLDLRMRDIKDGSINILEEMFDRNAISAQAAAECEPFLRTGSDGSGWGNKGVMTFKTMSSIPHARLFLNARKRDIMYNYVMDPTFQDGDDVPQFIAFLRFYRFLSSSANNIKFGKPARRDEDTVVAMLQGITVLGTQISTFWYQMTKRIHQISFLPLLRPVPFEDILNRDSRLIRRVYLPVMGITSGLKMIQVDEMEAEFLGIQMVKFGEAVKEFCEEFVFWYWFAKARFPRSLMDRAQRIEFALNSVETQTGMKEILRNAIIGTPLVRTIKLPPADTISQYWNDRYQIAEDYLWANHTNFGFATSFFMDPDARVVVTKLCSIEYKRRQRTPDIVITEPQFREALRQKTLTSLIGNAVARGELIEFKIPIQFQVKYFEEPSEVVEQDPFFLTDSGGVMYKDVSYRPIVIWRQLTKTYYSTRANEHVTFRKPRFFVDDDPGIRAPPDELLSQFHHSITVLRNEVSEYNEFEFRRKADY